MNKRKWLYLPMDVQVRELHSKMLLATKAASHGYIVVIGRKALVDKCAMTMPKGIYLGFALVKNFRNLYKKLKIYGHRVVSMDEEGLIRFSDKVYKESRIDADCSENVELILASGTSHKNLIEDSLADYSGKVASTGNPRFDLLLDKRFRDLFGNEVARIKANYKKFILINSTFPILSLYTSSQEYLEAMEDKKLVNTECNAQWYTDRYEFKKKTLEALKALVRELATSFKDINIVIRPHPSEIEGILWSDVETEFKNVFIVKEGAIYPWLMACDLLLHNDCTTAFEAHLIGKPVIAFNPVLDDRFQTLLPIKVSKSIGSAKELIPIIQATLTGSDKFCEIKVDGLDEHLESLKGGNSSSDMIINEFNKIDMKLVDFSYLSLLAMQLRFFKADIKSRLNKLMMGRSAADSEYISTKFPGICEKEIKVILHKLSKENAISGLKIKKIYDSVFLVQSSSVK